MSNDMVTISCHSDTRKYLQRMVNDQTTMHHKPIYDDVLREIIPEKYQQQRDK